MRALRPAILSLRLAVLSKLLASRSIHIESDQLKYDLEHFTDAVILDKYIYRRSSITAIETSMLGHFIFRLFRRLSPSHSKGHVSTVRVPADRTSHENIKLNAN